MSMSDLKGNSYEAVKGEYFGRDQIWTRQDGKQGYFMPRGMFDFVPLDSARHQQRAAGVAQKQSRL